MSSIIQPGGPQAASKLAQDQLVHLARRLHVEVTVMKLRLMEMHNLTVQNGRIVESQDKDSFIIAIRSVNQLQADLQDVLGSPTGPIVIAGGIPEDILKKTN